MSATTRGKSEIAVRAECVIEPMPLSGGYGWRVRWPNGGQVSGSAATYRQAVKRIREQLWEARPR